MHSPFGRKNAAYAEPFHARLCSSSARYLFTCVEELEKPVSLLFQQSYAGPDRLQGFIHPKDKYSGLAQAQKARLKRGELIDDPAP